MPAVEELNLGHLSAGLTAGAFITIVALWWPRVRPGVAVLLAGTIAVQVDPYLADRLTPALISGTAILALALGLASWSMARNAGPPLIGVLALMALVGCWACLPDTEGILTTIGVVTPVVLVTFWRVPVTGTMLPALAAAVAWVIALSAVGRPAAAVGAAGCFGVILLLPAVAIVDRRSWSLLDPAAAPTTTAGVVAVQAVIVAICARVAGVSDDLGFALAVTAATLISGGVVLLIGGRAVSRSSAPI